jgi:SAM-dependent methyltransferase
MTAQRQTDSNVPTDSVELVEPLRISAPLAYRRAMAGCPRDMAGVGYGCYSYHGIWQYLRLFKFVEAVGADSSFYIDAFREMARDKKHRVLISGTADYGMLAQILHGFGLEGCAPDVQVVDLCETPLYLNRWYAERLRVSLKTTQAHILQFDAHPVDLICTHSFMHNFRSADRPSLVSKWYQLLRPGGKVVLTNSLRDTTPALTRKYTSDEALVLRDGVRKAAQAHSSSIDLDPEALAEIAFDFATRRRRYNLRTIQEVRELFEGGGFRFEQLFELPVTMRRDSPATSLGSPKMRVHVVATRPR